MSSSIDMPSWEKGDMPREAPMKPTSRLGTTRRILPPLMIIRIGPMKHSRLRSSPIAIRMQAPIGDNIRDFLIILASADQP
jgi:hypothetical protein